MKGSCRLTGYIFWPDGVKGDLNLALVLLGLVLHVLVVFIYN